MKQFLNLSLEDFIGSLIYLSFSICQSQSLFSLFLPFQYQNSKQMYFKILPNWIIAIAHTFVMIYGEHVYLNFTKLGKLQKGCICVAICWTISARKYLTIVVSLKFWFTVIEGRDVLISNRLHCDLLNNLKLQRILPTFR